MNIWITGARGFIGRHLSHYLGQSGHDVAGIGHGLWHEDERTLWAVNHWLNADITQANLDILLQQHGVPDAIFNLAGGSSVGPSFLMPLEDMYRGVSSAAEVLEWVRLRAPEAAVVMTSSCAVYGAGHIGPIRETDLVTPYSPYGYHKRMAEILMQSYAQNFGLKIAIVRLFSVYGAGLRKQLLWDACSRMSRGIKVIEFGGTGRELRDWIHVEDAARVLYLALEKASANGFFLNGGSGIATSVREITEVLCKEWGEGVSPVFSGEDREGDPESLVANVEALQSLGFKSKYKWKVGLAEYVAWFKGQRFKG